MTQTLFGSNATPSLPLLDANFAELYASINGTGGLAHKTTGAGSTGGSVATSYTLLGHDRLCFVDSTRSANNRQKSFLWAGGAFYGRFGNDADSSATDWLQVVGGQAAGVSSILLNATSVNIGAPDWTGAFAKLSAYGANSTGRTVSAWNSHNSAGSALLARVDFTATRLAEFYYTGATSVGTITTNGTTTAYNTSSDARLKTDVADAANAGAVIDAMRVVSFKWKSSGEFSRFGFIAQELHQVAPEAVSAGDSADEIEMTWGVDPSKLVPLLVKELQTLRLRVAALEAA